MKHRRVAPLLSAVVLFLVFLLIPESVLARLLTHQQVADAADWQDVSRFRNVLFQDAAYAYGGFLPFYGSSTIGIFSRYHPSNAITTPFMPYLQGESACTSILHVLSMAAVGGSLAHKKLVFMLDPADFMNPNGMADQRFTDLYTKLPAYEFVFDRNVDQSSKKKVAAELLRYSSPKKDPLLRTVLVGMTSSDRWTRLKGLMLEPAAYLSMKVQEKQDALRALRLIGKIKPYSKQQPAPNLTWDQLEAQATKEAAGATNNNHYGMLNAYFQKTIEPTLAKSKKSWKPGPNFLKSVEYDNFQAILDILKAEKAEPLFILIPRKGAWSDYIGFTKPYRDKVYDKMVQEATSAGFSVIDYRDKEYDPYFMRDLSHLGWDGWVQVDRDLLQAYGVSNLKG